MEERKVLVATVGLPRSGKTTWSQQASRHFGIPIVSPDAVRLAIHGQRFISLAEPHVWATVYAMIRALFIAGHAYVIVDATNVSRKRRDALRSSDWITEFKEMDTTIDVCRQRAAGDSELLAVIDRMLHESQPLSDDEIEFRGFGAELPCSFSRRQLQ